MPRPDDCFFTSDTHFGHTAILEHDKRPFATIQEHDEELIRRWNEKVHPGAVLYHLGDFAWHHREVDVDVLLARLHGTKILIIGNHDATNKAVIRSKHWAQVTHYKEVTIGGQRIVLFHYPMITFNHAHHGAWALHGHCHGSLPKNYDRCSFDVGTMCWNYTPLSYHEVYEEMQKYGFKPEDRYVP